MACRKRRLVTEQHDGIVLLDHPDIAAADHACRSPAPLTDRGEDEPDRADDEDDGEDLHAARSDYEVNPRARMQLAYAARYRSSCFLFSLRP